MSFHFPRYEGLNHNEWGSTVFMVVSGGVLSEEYGHSGPWRLPGRWPDGGRRSTVAKWTRRRAAPSYAPIPDLTCFLFVNVCQLQVMMDMTDDVREVRWNRLNFLLQKSNAYTEYLLERMDEQKAEQKAKEERRARKLEKRRKKQEEEKAKKKTEDNSDEIQSSKPQEPTTATATGVATRRVLRQSQQNSQGNSSQKSETGQCVGWWVGSFG